MRSSCRYIAIALWILTLRPSSAKELIYLTSGFHLEALSHTEANQILLFETATGTFALPAASVEKIELVADDPRPAAVKSTIAVSRKPPEQSLADAALSQGLPPEFVRSVARVESGLHQDAVSSKGAIGLMQLMPGTAATLGVRPESAQENAEGGAKYLRSLLLHYRGDAVLALAAYNAGPGAVSKFGGIPPFPETRHYVERVLREFARQQTRTANATRHPASAASRPIAIN